MTVECLAQEHNTMSIMQSHETKLKSHFNDTTFEFARFPEKSEELMN